MGVVGNGETVRRIGALGQKEVPQSLRSRDFFEFLDDRWQMVRCALFGERPPLLSVGRLGGIDVGVHESGDPRKVLAGSCTRSEIHVIPSGRLWVACCGSLLLRPGSLGDSMPRRAPRARHFSSDGGGGGI